MTHAELQQLRGTCPFIINEVLFAVIRLQPPSPQEAGPGLSASSIPVVGRGAWKPGGSGHPRGAPPCREAAPHGSPFLPPRPPPEQPAQGIRLTGLQEEHAASGFQEGGKGKKEQEEVEHLAVFKGSDPQTGNGPHVIGALLRGPRKGPWQYEFL